MAKKKRVEEDRVDPRKIASSNQFDKLYEVAESCLKIAESRRRDKTKVKLIKKKLKESLDGSS